jgi:hypothetical protein
MFNKGEKIFAAALVAACVIVSIVGYSFSGPSSPPNKVWFDSAGGDVILDHAYHVDAAECSDCHHNFDEDSPSEGTEMNCRSCHYFGEARDLRSDDAPTHKRFIGANCIECHNSAEIEVKCDSCHIRKGFAFKEWVREMP